MSHKTEPQQNRLFNPEDLDYRTSVELVDGYEVFVSYGHEGSYIDTAQRAGHLVLALDAMSQRNIRDGISGAAYTDLYSAPIWDRYKDATPNVLDGASRNRNSYQNQLRRSFWVATGFAAIRGMGLMPERQINPRAQKMWRDFNASYGHPQKLKERNKYKKMLEQQIPSDEQLKLVA